MGVSLSPPADNALVFLVSLWAVSSFYFVGRKVVRIARAGRLLGNENAPPPFLISPLLGWGVALGTVFLVLVQSFYFYLSAPLIVGAAGEEGASRFGWGRLPWWRVVRDGLLICGAFLFLITPLSAITKSLFDYFHWPDQEQDSVDVFNHLTRPSDILFFIFQAALLAPFMEELFFRGFLFTFLKKYLSPGLAILISGAVFGFVHLNLASFYPLWAFGVILALTYEYTGSLLLCMAVHGFFNLGTALALLLQK